MDNLHTDYHYSVFCVFNNHINKLNKRSLIVVNVRMSKWVRETVQDSGINMLLINKRQQHPKKEKRTFKKHGVILTKVICIWLLLTGAVTSLGGWVTWKKFNIPQKKNIKIKIKHSKLFSVWWTNSHIAKSI